MTATDLLTELHRRGVELRPDGERLLYRPRDAVSPELVEEIREHKTELVAMLSGGEELGLEREAILAEANMWSRLADSGLCHNDVHDLAQVLFLFACELIADPDRGQFPGDLPRTWGCYSPHWSERLPQEAFEELERRYRRRLAHLGLQEASRPSQGPTPLRALELNAEGTGCAECGSADYWVSGTGARFCLACCPVFFKDAIAIGRLSRQEETRRPSMRRKAGGGRA